MKGKPERPDAYASALLIAMGGQQQGDFAIPEETRLAYNHQER